MIHQMLVDTGFLYALFDLNDRYHNATTAVTQRHMGVSLVPDVVLVEAMFLARRSGGIAMAVRFLETFEQSDFVLQPLILPDITRAREIMTTYADNRFDFVDCSIMALSERLGIQHVCTIDHTDFMIFRPQHCNHLSLLPSSWD